MKARKTIAILTLCGLLTGAIFLLLSPAPNTRILVSNATAAPLSGSPGTLAVFLTIDNQGGADTLVSASAADAEQTEILGADTPLPIAGTDRASFAPDGAYIRLSGVNGNLADGRTFPISLTFSNAGTVTTRARLIAARTVGKAADFGLFGIGDICLVGDGEPAPEISLTSTKGSDGWTIEVVSRDFEFTPDLADGPHVPGTGHGHIYLNGMKLGRLYSATHQLGGLPAGDHEIRVTLSTNDHRAYVVDDSPVSALIRISNN